MRDGRLMARHAGAPEHPFVELDKLTLAPKQAQVTYRGAAGKEMPLKWTSKDTQYPSDSQ